MSMKLKLLLRLGLGTSFVSFVVRGIANRTAARHPLLPLYREQQEMSLFASRSRRDK